MSWLDTVKRFFWREQSGQVAELARGASGEASMPRMIPGAPDSGMAGPYSQLATMLAIDNDLMLRYADYENMDDYPEISAALDIYADDATVTDTVHGKVIWGLSKDKVIRDIINDLLERRLRIEDEIWTAIRTLAKYGNLYAEVVVNENGVLGLNWLPPPTMRRIVDARGNLVGYAQDPTGAFAFQLSTREDLEKLRAPQGQGGPTGNAVFFYPWEVVHWRLRGKQMRALYGYSMLDSARWVWKRLLMLEDSALVMRLQKAPARFAFYIDTGDVPPREARAIVDEVRRRYKKKRIIDPATGKLDFRFNPLSSDEDFFIPTRAGKEATRIETLAGPDYDDTNVMSYFLKKLYAAIRIPPQYLGGTEVTNRAALTQEDVQFARLEIRLQHEFVTGLNQVVRVHLAALNIDPDSVRWGLRMPTPSSVFEMQQIEVWNSRAGLAASLQPFFTAQWIMANIFHMTDEDALYASEAKAREVSQQALDQAETQAEIMQRYPELGPMGAMQAAEPEAMGGLPMMPPQEAPAEDVRRRLDRALTEMQAEQAQARRVQDKVLRSLNRIEPTVLHLGRLRTGSK